MKNRERHIDYKGLYSVWRRTGSVLFFCMLVAAVLSLPSSLHAQSKIVDNISIPLTLKDTQDQYNLLPYVYHGVAEQTLRQPSDIRLRTIKEFMDNHDAGLGRRGETVNGGVYNLGSTGDARFLVFTLNNESWNDRWVLSFGRRFEGRVGLIQKMFIRQSIADRAVVLFDNLEPNKNPYVDAKKISGTFLPVRVPRGTKTTFYMLLVGEPGMPSTINLKVLSQDAYAKNISSSYSMGNLVNFYLIVLIGFFVAGMIYTRSLGGSLFILYFILQLAIVNYGDNDLFPDFMLSSKIPGFLFCVSVIVGMMASKVFLDIGKLQRIQGRAIFFCIMAICCSALLGLVVSKESVIAPLIIYVPAMIGMFFMFLLSLAQAQNERYASVQFAFSWLVLFAGACVTFLSLTNILSPVPVMITGYWWALIIQGFMFISAMTTKFILQEKELEEVEEAAEKETKSLEVLKQSREASENARLLRLIEHERQVMNELREREVQQNEEMRKATEYADEANRAKSAFLAVVSHEIRTPMTGIMGMVRLLQETSLEKDQREYSQTIQDSGDAMMALLNDILDFEKIESGKMDLEKIDFDLHRVVNSIKTLMSGHADAKGIYLRAEIDPSIPRYVIGDPVRLRQVLLNLTGNSIKFTEKGGVTLRIKPASGSDKLAQQGVHKISFAVEDTGVGISKEGQKNLFNPFAQADSSVTRKFGGTGLGLAISQKLIEAQGGRIEINSTEGHGSTFFFTLVMEHGRAEVAEDSPSALTPAAEDAQKMRILIVEDNEINQKLLKEFIDRMGHETKMAGSGEEAIEIINENEFDMILMDIELPGMTGMGTTKAIRALSDPEKAKLPVIALTGNVRDEDVRACYAANMNGHLAKPVDPKKLKNMIEKVVKNELDNPVVVEEGGKSEFTQVNKVELPVTKASVPEKPPISSATTDNADGTDEEDYIPGEDAAASLVGDDEYQDDSDDTGTEDGGGADDVAPITQFARKGEDEPKASTDLAGELDEPTIKGDMKINDMADLTEEELDSDSFAEAIEVAEEKEKEPQTATANGNGAANGAGHTEAAGSQVFDMEMLDNLKSSVSREQLHALIEDLFDKTEEIITALQSADMKDTNSIAQRAHELKGMAGNFGLVEVSTIAGKAEDAAKESKTDGLGDLLENLPDAASRARNALQDWMSE